MPTRLEQFLLRFPYAAVALRHDLSVDYANDRARTLLGPAAVRVGEPFGASSPPELRRFAASLVDSADAPAPAEILLGDGRILKVSGLTPTAAEEHAFLFAEEVSEHHRQDRVLHEFLRNAAHQLRTPVAGITAAVELLQAGAKERPDDRDRFLGHIERHADRLRRVAHAILQLARARAGEAPLLDPVALGPVFDRVVEEVERDGITVLADCPPGLSALASQDLLHEALVALLDNAAAHAGRGKIRLSAERSGRAVVIAVADEGPGIAPELLDRIFEPFFQADSLGAGFGLGLAIAAQAVETIGGQIDVSSEPGSGTTFIVRLRAATIPA